MTNATKIETKQDARDLIGNSIFGAKFIKRDGTLRTGSFRVHVKKNLTGAGSSYDRDARRNLTVYDMVKEAYRTIRLDSVIELTVKGETFTVAISA